MDKIAGVKIVLGFLFTVLCIIGLNCNIYSWRSKRFYTNYFLLLWCIFVIIAFIIIYVKQFYIEFITDQIDLKNDVSLYHNMNIISALINYISQLIITKDAEHFFINIQLFEPLRYFDIKAKVINSTVLLVYLKTIIFPIIIEVTLILRELQKVEEQNLWWTLYILYPYVVSSIIPNCIFSSLAVCRQFTTSLNEHLTELEKEANSLQNIEQIILHKSFYRMQRFCCLADKLDELADKYSMICAQTTAYIKLAAIPILFSFLCNLFRITAYLFQLYNALADTLINEESYDVFNAIINCVFLIISFLEIGWHSLVANDSIETIKETGLILKRIRLDHVDVRFRQSVEQFSLKIFIVKFKIHPMGLLEINMSLLQGVLSAVTSFLLILIQSDLTLRFSLK